MHNFYFYWPFRRLEKGSHSNRHNKIWSLILLVLTVLGCLGTLGLILVVQILMPGFEDFDRAIPGRLLLFATPAVRIPLELTMIATIALLILKEIRIPDKGKCLSINIKAFCLSCLATAIIVYTVIVPICLFLAPRGCGPY